MAERRVSVLRAAASILTAPVLLVGVPVVLARESAFLAGTRRLLRPGGLERAWHGLLQPPDAAVWHGALVLALWLVWLWFVTCVVVELLAGTARLAGSARGAGAGARGRERGPGRVLASLLVGPLFVVLAAQSRHAAPARVPAPAVSTLASDIEAPPTAPAHSVSGDAPPPAAPAAGTAAATSGRSPLTALLAGIGGAVLAVAVEEYRRLADTRELRRLRRSLLADEGHQAEPAGPLPPGEAPLSSVSTRVVPPTAPAPGEVRVRLLGEILVDGAPGPFDRPKVVESLAYLVLHPDGVSKQRWATALWPERALSPNSLNTAVWQLRRALGVDGDGERHLPAARSGRLRLGTGVRSDLAELEALAAEGSTASLRRALELVRGRPFEGLGDPDWVVLEGHASRAESAVAAAALALGERLISEGDPAGAAAAARQAVAACPYDERLYHLLADAAGAAGNRVAAAAAMAELRRAVDPTARDAESCAS